VQRQFTDLQQALEDLGQTLAREKAHKNEVLSLGTRFRRSQSAKEVLAGVKFTDCPSCGQQLPHRSSDLCPLCGQVPVESATAGLEDQAAERDMNARVEELTWLALASCKYRRGGGINACRAVFRSPC